MDRVERLRDLHQRLGCSLKELMDMRELITELIGEEQVESVGDKALERARLMRLLARLEWCFARYQRLILTASRNTSGFARHKDSNETK